MWRIHFRTPGSEETRSFGERSDHLEKGQEKTDLIRSLGLPFPHGLEERTRIIFKASRFLRNLHFGLLS